MIISAIININIFYLAMGGVAGVPAPLAAVTVRIKAVLGVVTATEENYVDFSAQHQQHFMRRILACGCCCNPQWQSTS